ncbi:hypothetical protein QJS10_CPA10g00684 [Acorus calamus]|uniref:Uncharacterized protein n=1 Tax=Acorus calamus TaxID=4465 RepID=A0AAV9DXL2_ACOCL|nr:hypothetical protein QJS10_CPA10g00684 [Acorus calamus]
MLWFQYDGDGFSIRVPPQFDDVTEPEVGKRGIFRSAATTPSVHDDHRDRSGYSGWPFNY